MNQSIPELVRRISSFILVTVVLSACGGGNGGGNPPPPPPPPPPSAPFNAVFSEIQANVFTPTCATAGCHTGAGAPQGLQLDETNSFALLVGVNSSEVPNLQRVAPGDPGNSYLIQKLEGTAAAGARMPLGGTPLDPAVIAVMRQWITDGATDDRAPAAAPIRVSSISVVPGSVIDAAPTQVIAGFDRQPDASTVNANTFTLYASGGDTTFGDGNEIQITATSITVPMANPQTAVFDLTGVALADDTYRIQLLGNGASLIMDLDANALDGEYTGNFPSGDGTQGGDFEVTFTVMAPVVMGPTLDEIQAAVFTPSCSTAGCHSGPAGNTLPTGMDLTNADASFASLVNVQSLQPPAFLRVAPGNPDDSYLIQKLEGTAGAGQQMPLIGGPLNQAVIDDIREWITNGAQR